MTIVMVGNSITSAYQVVYLYRQLYPTCLRTQGLGVSSMVGRIGSISPFINDMLRVWWPGITCLLPETKDKTLPDTVDDVEAWRSPALNKRERPRDVAASEEDQREESWLNPPPPPSSSRLQHPGGSDKRRSPDAVDRFCW
ncbi:Solute carrier family 22 member 15-like 4 [Homarus americanus]|uniref:Solute carrier family 22 member 15-like 4 n=1 Tax=Homarus americanus TaxID=6706 RepID=A0A8J5JQN7_HOMAM|nr:Solute carrier family 22 member 15-like 4 [Homarus americanus]